jgi:type VI secretion system protein ImpE
MTAAEAKLRGGDLAGCLADLQAEVRRDPSNAKLRVFLAQLFMVKGDWERALTQLSVIAEMDAGALPMAHAYRSAVDCEQLRQAVFAAGRSPVIFGDPEPWIASLIEALGLLAKGHGEQAAALRSQAFEAAPATRGTLNGEAFEWIADTDSRLGPILEVLLNGAYYWVPFHRIQRIVLEPPADLRDFVWLPAQFTWANGGEAVGLIPARYPGTESSDDSALLLARRTEWVPIGTEAQRGLGQRVLATSEADVSLFEVRELVLEPVAG